MTVNVSYVVQRTYPAQLTGSEIYIHQLATQIAKTHNVSIFTTGKRHQINYSNQIKYYIFRETPIYLFTSPVSYILRKVIPEKGLHLISYPLSGFFHSSSWHFFSFSLKSSLELEKESDIIHAAAVPTGSLWAAWQASIRKKKNFVVTPFLHYEISDFTLPYVKKMLNDASAVIAVTNKEAQVIKSFGVNSNKIYVIPLGIDLNLYNENYRSEFREKYDIGDDFFAILIPRKSKSKGTFDTLEAILKLSRIEHKLVLILLDKDPVGYEKELLDRYKQSLKDLNVKVLDLGYISNNMLRMAFMGSDVLVEPSTVDSFGYVYLEAWASNIPVIAADSGAISEVVNDKLNGLLVQPGNVEDIVRAIRHLILNPDFRILLAKNGRKKVEDIYNIANMAKKTLQVYQELLNY